MPLVATLRPDAGCPARYLPHDCCHCTCAASSETRGDRNRSRRRRTMMLRSDRPAIANPLKPVKPINLNPARIHTGRVAALGLVLLCLLAVDGSVAQTGAGAPKPIAATQNAAIAPPTLHSATASDAIHITLGRSAVLTSSSPLHRVYVSNPAVLQTYTSGSSEIVLTAKSPASAALFCGMKQADIVSMRSLQISIQPLCAAHSMRPSRFCDPRRDRRRQDLLTGSVANDAASDAAFKMASLYSKDVVNSLASFPNTESKFSSKFASSRSTARARSVRSQHLLRRAHAARHLDAAVQQYRQLAAARRSRSAIRSTSSYTTPNSTSG